MSSLDVLRQKLQQFKMRRYKKPEATGDQALDSTGNTTDHRTWMRRIEQQGNKADDWLVYTSALVQNYRADADPFNRAYDEICNTYSKAIKAVAESSRHKCEAYARLFVNYANFVSEKDVDDARDLFYGARTNLRNYAVTHIFAAQFELKQGNKDKCRKIFDKAMDLEVEPKSLLDAAHMNYLLGFEEFITNELIAKHTTATPPVTLGGDMTDGGRTASSSLFDTSRDSGVSFSSCRSDNTSSINLDQLRQTSTRGCSSSDDSLPISTNLSSNYAFSKPLVPKASGTTAMPSLIKPAPAKRELQRELGDTSVAPMLTESPLPMAQGPRSRHSMWNNAFQQPESEEEGTISFNTQDKGRKQMGSGSSDGNKENDTVPLMFDSSVGQYNRPLRNSHSTPDCKTASSLSMVSSRKKRFVGKAQRMLPLKEYIEVTQQEKDLDELSLPPMPDLDNTGTIENPAGDIQSNVSASTTLTNTTAGSQHSTLIKSPTNNLSEKLEAAPSPTEPPTAPIPTITKTSPPSSSALHPTQSPLHQDQKEQHIEPMHFETPASKSHCKSSTNHHPEVAQSAGVQAAAMMTPAMVRTAPAAQNVVVTPAPRLPGGVSSRVAHTSGPVQVTTSKEQHIEPMHFETPASKSHCKSSTNHHPEVAQSAGVQAAAMMTPAMVRTAPAAQNVVVTPAPRLPGGVSSRVAHTSGPVQVTTSKVMETLMVNNEPYSVLNCIGTGGSSSVYAVIDEQHNVKAIKIVDMSDADEPTVRSYKNEIALLQKLQKSDRVITMHDFEFNEENNILYVVMEQGDVDLATYFSRNKKLGNNKIVYFWEEMLQAVQALHEQGVIHTDLKPANFMLVSGHLKLIDFGIAKSIQQDHTSVTTDQQVGTLNFMSPEALMADSYGSEYDEHGHIICKHKIGYKSDVWSLGCILYRMVYGRTPFQAIRNQLQKMKAIINPNHCINFPDIADPKLHNVLQICLIRDPRERPGIDDLLNHSFLKHTKELQMPSDAQATMMKLMEQMATASPTTLSTCREKVKGLLEQLKGGAAAPAAPTHTAPAQAAGAQRKDLSKPSASTARSVQRTPLASVNQPMNH